MIISQKEFLSLIFNNIDTINISYIEEPKKEENKIISKSYIYDNKLIIKQPKGYGAFFCPNPLKKGTKRNENNLALIKTIFIDFDKSDIDISSLSVLPNIVNTRTETNKHLFYLIEPIKANEKNIEKYKKIVNYFTTHYGADKVVNNPGGLIRLPYTNNYKHKEKSEYSSVLLEKKRYYIDEIINLLEITEEKEETEKTIKPLLKNFDPAEYVFNRNKHLRIPAGNGRSHKLLHLGYECRDWNIPEKTALEIVKQLNNIIFDIPETLNILKHQIKSAYKYARNEQGQRLKEFNEADDTKKQNKILSQAHEEERVREKLVNYVFILSNGQIVHKEKNETYINRDFINYFLLTSINTQLPFNKILIRGLIQVVDGVDFRPDIKEQFYNNADGLKIINRFTGIPYEKEKVDIEDKTGIDLFKAHIYYLTTTEYEYKTLLCYIAHNIQNPGIKIPYAPLLINKAHGTGRSWLGDLMTKLLKDYTIGVNHDNIKSGYTQYLANKLLIFIHEIKDNDKFTFMDKMKTRITEKLIYVEEKYTRSYILTDTTNYMFFSNYIDALKIDNFDRRLFVILNEKEPNETEYYNNLYNILNTPEQLTAVYNYLLNYDLSDYNAFVRPEMTKGKQIMIDSNMSELMLYLNEIYVQDDIFKTTHILLRDIQNYVQENGSYMIRNKVSEKQIKHFLTEKGYQQIEINKRINDKRVHKVLWTKDKNLPVSKEYLKQILERVI